MDSPRVRNIFAPFMAWAAWQRHVMTSLSQAKDLSFLSYVEYKGLFLEKLAG